MRWILFDKAVNFLSCFLSSSHAEIPCEESSLKDMNALLTDVQSIVRQLGQVQRLAASESS